MLRTVIFSEPMALILSYFWHLAKAMQRGMLTHAKDTQVDRAFKPKCLDAALGAL